MAEETTKIGEIGGISEADVAALRRLTVLMLPDSPAAEGMPAEAVKKYFYQWLIDNKQSIVALINRIVGDVNNEFGKIVLIKDHVENIKNQMEGIKDGVDKVLGEKLNKSTSHSVVYANDGEGMPSEIGYAEDDIKNTIPVRDGAGRLKVSNGTSGFHAVNNNVLNSKLSSYLPRTSDTSSVYVNNGSGNVDMIKYSSSNKGATIMSRTIGGTAKVNDPTTGLDIVNLQTLEKIANAGKVLVDKNSNEIADLRSLIQRQRFYTDQSTSMQKEVPDNALSNAAVLRVSAVRIGSGNLMPKFDASTTLLDENYKVMVGGVIVGENRISTSTGYADGGFRCWDLVAYLDPGKYRLSITVNIPSSSAAGDQEFQIGLYNKTVGKISQIITVSPNKSLVGHAMYFDILTKGKYYLIAQPKNSGLSTIGNVYVYDVCVSRDNTYMSTGRYTPVGEYGLTGIVSKRSDGTILDSIDLSSCLEDHGSNLLAYNPYDPTECNYIDLEHQEIVLRGRLSGDTWEPYAPVARVALKDVIDNVLKVERGGSVCLTPEVEGNALFDVEYQVEVLE